MKAAKSGVIGDRLVYVNHLIVIGSKEHDIVEVNKKLIIDIWITLY